jgi:Fe-S-cluster containining protein
MKPEEVINLVCMRCGACCYNLPDGPYVTPDDMAAIVRHINVSEKFAVVLGGLAEWLVPAPAHRLGEAEPPGKGYCPCLSHKDGIYRCAVFPARPAMCRAWNCEVVWALLEYMEDANVDANNPFHGVASLQEAVNLALANTPRAAAGRIDPPFAARWRRRMGSIRPNTIEHAGAEVTQDSGRDDGGGVHGAASRVAEAVPGVQPAATDSDREEAEVVPVLVPPVQNPGDGENVP